LDLDNFISTISGYVPRLQSYLNYSVHPSIHTCTIIIPRQVECNASLVPCWLVAWARP
jgi:hypothetical protein